MPGFFAGENLRFLFRTDQGRVSKRTWWAGFGLLATPFVLLTIGWMLLAPYAHRGLDERALIDAPTLGAYVYLLIYTFVGILIGVSFLMLSMKRLRDRGRPTAIAAAPLLAGLAVGSAHWLQPRLAGLFSAGWLYAGDALLVAVIAWAIYELGVAD